MEDRDGLSRPRSPILLDGLEGEEEFLPAAEAGFEGEFHVCQVLVERIEGVVVNAENLSERVDEQLAALWAAQGIHPAGPSSDAEFMRRAYLDLTGRIPTVTEAREFLEDESPDRRAQLVDRLLEHHDHATHLAAVWRGLPANSLDPQVHELRLLIGRRIPQLIDTQLACLPISRSRRAAETDSLIELLHEFTSDSVQRYEAIAISRQSDHAIVRQRIEDHLGRDDGLKPLG